MAERLSHFFQCWSEQGKFERMNDRLRAKWQEREGGVTILSVTILNT